MAEDRSPRRNWRRFSIQMLLQTGVGGALLWLWLRSFDFHQVSQRAAPRQWLPLALLLALGAASNLLRAWRFGVLLDSPRARLRDLFWLNATGGLINYVIPIRAGDGLRVWWAARRGGVQPGRAVVAVVADKAFDLFAVCLGLVLAAGLGLLFPEGGRRTLLVAAVVAAMGVIGILTVVFVLPRMLTWGFLPTRLRGYLDSHLHAFIEGRDEVFRAHRLLRLSLLSGLALLCDGLSFLAIFAALDISVSPLGALGSLFALTLSFTLPSAPGYVGTVELVGFFLVSSLGIGPLQAAGAVLLWHACGAVLTILYGLPGAAFTFGRRLIPHRLTITPEAEPAP